MRVTITTQRELRRLFWEFHGDRVNRRKVRGDYCTDTRVAFVDWVDGLQRSGVISEALAGRAVL